MREHHQDFFNPIAVRDSPVDISSKENAELIRIGAAQAEHLSDIRKVFEEYADSLGFDLDFQNFSEELETLPEEYSPPNGRLLLATFEEQIAGCVALRRIDAEIREVKRLDVRHEFRGLERSPDLYRSA